MSFTYPKYVRFECNRCGLCCGDVKDKIRTILLLKAEAEEISIATSINVGQFTEKIENFPPYMYMMRKTRDGKCIFLKNGSCFIYKYRPLICKFYPFKLQNRGSKGYIFIPTNECPGIGEGHYLKKSFFNKLFEEFKQSTSRIRKESAEPT